MTPCCPMHWRVETPWGPMYRGDKTPRCPMYRGVTKLDPLKIQKSPKYQRVETPRCPRYRRVETPQCPKQRGVKTLQCFVSQNSPVSYGTGESRLPGVLCTRESFFVSLNLQAHAAPIKQNSFKKLFNFSIYYTNTVQTYLKNFPN